MKPGDKIKILTTGQIIIVDELKELPSGKYVVMYHYKDGNNLPIKAEVYLEVLEMIGIDYIN